ncbi:latent-transforming growth factor beta-binding protein 4-like [Liolophura sinensis]|uniref:latent-transforming growth factor beta-binding protein 4-like n=1 Tax=Liolophura sinensis TaxID=3198878 RepID=UPI0031595083
MLSVIWTVVSLLLAFSVTCNSQDRNECDGVSPCSHNADCVNTVGSYRCSCQSGFKGNGIVCTDIDECEQYPCGHRKCQNTPGSYRCLSECIMGYIYRWNSGNLACVDIDECEQHPCGLRKCQNTPGSYRCLSECITGYTYRWNSGNLACVVLMGTVILKAQPEQRSRHLPPLSL